MSKRCKARLCAALMSVFVAFGAVGAHALETSAKAAVLIEAGTGKVLFAKNAHKRLPMASTTKIMTALVAIENGKIDELVETDASAYGVEGSSIYLQLEERMSLRDLLYGLMLSSGNDAAVAIAIHIGKGTQGFADMMNNRALELGAFNTNFVTPNGLHDEAHYTTAYDLARIAAAAMRQPLFRQIVQSEYHRTTTGSVQRTFKNKNRILWEYEGGNGIKTGYTLAAGKCLVFAAERDGMQLIGVVLNCPNMFEEAKAMLDHGFDNYETATILKAGQSVARTPVIGGEKNSLELVAADDIIVPVEKNGEVLFQTRVMIDDDIRAPVSAGDALGCVEVLCDGALVAKCRLLAAADVSDAGIGFYFGKLIRRFAA